MHQRVLPPTSYLRLQRRRGGTVVELRGEIDIHAVTQIRPVLDKVTSAPVRRLVLVLDEVEFLDCCGVGLLCRVRRRVAERGGRLVLVCSDPAGRRLLALLGLLPHFRIAPSREEALAEPLSPRSAFLRPEHSHTEGADRG